jgi:hypothetical protein
MEGETEFKGRSQTVRVENDALVIKYAAWAHGFKGEKRIPFSSIASVQFREPGFMTIGYIQLGIVGALEAGGGLMNAMHDENTVAFEKRDLEAFKRLRDMVERRSADARKPAIAPSSSTADEIAKLAELRAAGVLTEEEFQTLKGKLI